MIAALLVSHRSLVLQVFLGTVQQGGGSSWTVYRAFEAFQRLGQQLAMIFGQAVPACPPRMFDLRFPDSLEKARVDLSMWMMQLLQHPPIYQSHVFVDFVSTDANVPPPGLHNAAAGGQAAAARNIGDLDMDEMFDSTTDDDPRSHDELHDDDVSSSAIEFAMGRCCNGLDSVLITLGFILSNVL